MEKYLADARLRGDKIYVAGANGMVGSAVARLLRAKGFQNLLLPTRSELDLRDGELVADFFGAHAPAIVILAAARVGGIQANMESPAEFLYDNLAIQNNVIHCARTYGVRKLCFLGSSCIYPRAATQPMRESDLLTGPLEPTNEGYALAKIAGIKLVEFYRKQYGFNGISLIPCNLYGTGDSFDSRHSHVLSALVRKFVDATIQNQKAVTMWGLGKARREFMHVDDAASAVVHMLDVYESGAILNVGWGDDVSIAELAAMVAREVGFDGEMIWDASKPEGMPRKCMDVTRMRELGFSPSIVLAEGIRRTVAEYRTRHTRTAGMAS